ncbi:hypothetical protein SEPCBS119000_005224 [Sporothrix epigloea]|uniref:Uncharacterized protein n=1 Tax=Sporothrix epigloea TaxID=1892477 RepID=A0ABP0DXJ9_9PEZI
MTRQDSTAPLQPAPDKVGDNVCDPVHENVPNIVHNTVHDKACDNVCDSAHNKACDIADNKACDGAHVKVCEDVCENIASADKVCDIKACDKIDIKICGISSDKTCEDVNENVCEKASDSVDNKDCDKVCDSTCDSVHSKFSDETVVNDEEPVTVDAAVQGPIVVDNASFSTCSVDEDEEEIPETQPAEFIAVPALQPMKRQKMGFEPSLISAESFMGTPKKFDHNSSPPPAPPPTPVIPQLEFVMPPPNGHDFKFHSVSCGERQGKLKGESSINGAADEEEVDGVDLVKTEPGTPLGASPPDCASKDCDCGDEVTFGKIYSSSSSSESTGDECIMMKRRSPRIKKA